MKNNIRDIMRKRLPAPDLSLFIIIILLAFFGTIMIFSASSSYSYARYNDAFYFIKRQLIWLCVGGCVMHVASRISPKKYKSATAFFYVAVLLLLLLVLVVGFVGNGAKRWISIGPVTIQPSEMAKLTLIMMMALYFSKFETRALSKKRGEIFKFGTLIPIAIMLVPIILVMLQKHLSCIIILSAIGLCMIVASGANLKYIAGFGALGGAGITCLAVFTDYTKERIMVWRDPEAYRLTGGWQTLQGLMAIGSGGIFGVGFGKSVMKHCYVSEPANDMIFSILCEELGLIGALAVLGMFTFLVVRGCIVALRCEDVFSRLVAFGISAKMAIQVLLNVAVVTNSIPNTGISLPFFSYGGSSLIMLFFEMGILLSISRYSKITK